MAFWKPGGKKPDASLPLSAEVDRDAAGEGCAPQLYNTPRLTETETPNLTS